MNITFLIGNGFDIRMGIESAYKKVEAHYVALEKTDERLKAFQKSMAENGEYWSNFESAIGQYTKEFNDHEQENFQFCLDDFTEELIQYLTTEEAKIDYELCKEEIMNEFIRSLSNFAADIPQKYRNDIKWIIENGTALFFRFVSFNYTHILDECLRCSFTDETVVGTHVSRGTHYKHLVNGDVLHIHGDLPGPIIMGVDNQDQILNKNWAGQRRFRQKLAKPEINSRAGTLVDEGVINLIKESNIICIYGMSLGVTDKTWWKLLGSWLRGSDRRLVLFSHSGNYSHTGFTHQRQFTIQDELTDRFFDLAEIPNADRDNLENKIIAIINPNLFNINLVELTDQKKKVAIIEKEAQAKELSAEYEKHQKISELTGSKRP